MTLHKQCFLKRSAWGVALACSLLALPVHAAVITVTDTQGKALEDAVIEVYYPGDPLPSADERTIYQRDAAFHPKVITVPVASLVAFPNRDSTRHHVYSFSPAKTFELNLYLQETPPPVLFDQPGVVVLGCNIHDRMQAFIVVSDAPFTAKTGPDGVIKAPALPAGEHRVRVWHPQLDDRQSVWWEGRIQNDQGLEVRLELNATTVIVDPVSPLQKRFREAIES